MKTEIGFAVAGAAGLAAFIWLAFMLAAEPFLSCMAIFLAGFWGALSGAAFWALMNRWERRHGGGNGQSAWDYKPTVIWRR